MRKIPQPGSLRSTCFVDNLHEFPERNRHRWWRIKSFGFFTSVELESRSHVILPWFRMQAVPLWKCLHNLHHRKYRQSSPNAWAWGSVLGRSNPNAAKYKFGRKTPQVCLLLVIATLSDFVLLSCTSGIPLGVCDEIYFIQLGSDRRFNNRSSDRMVSCPTELHRRKWCHV